MRTAAARRRPGAVGRAPTPVRNRRPARRGGHGVALHGTRPRRVAGGDRRRAGSGSARSTGTSRPRGAAGSGVPRWRRAAAGAGRRAARVRRAGDALADVAARAARTRGLVPGLAASAMIAMLDGGDASRRRAKRCARAGPRCSLGRKRPATCAHGVDIDDLVRMVQAVSSRPTTAPIPPPPSECSRSCSKGPPSLTRSSCNPNHSVTICPTAERPPSR